MAQTESAESEGALKTFFQKVRTSHLMPTSKRIDREDDAVLVANMANIIAARSNDYANDAQYKAKIDALVDAILSQAVSQYVNQKYGGAITCDASSQIDLRK